MEKLSRLSHLFMTVFLYSFSTFMVIPAITDVTMSALCPGKDECSLAIYLTALQQAITGVGTLMMMPLIGNLSDTYGRKVILGVPMALTILPLVILSYSRSKNFVYTYYALKTLTSIVCEGSVLCLALAYVADNIAEKRRASAFGILSGIVSCAFVCGNLSTRFIPIDYTFQVAATGAVVAVLYMKILLPDSTAGVGISGRKGKDESSEECLLEKGSLENIPKLFNTTTCFNDSISLLRSSSKFSRVAIVAFFGSLAEIGLHASLLINQDALWTGPCLEKLVVSLPALNRSYTSVASICFYHRRLGKIWKCQYWSTRWGHLKPLKSMFSCIIPFKSPLFKKVGQGFIYNPIMLDKPSIVPCGGPRTPLGISRS